MNEAAQRVLIVEDEPKLAALLQDYLARAGYEVETLADGRAVAAMVREWQPDLIVLDLMLPGRDGMDVCRDLRAFSSVPIVMTTARVEEIDRLLGLEIGADDYVCKPYSPREVVARVKAILRRTAPRNPEEGAADVFVIDASRYLARVAGETLDLTPVEFRLLQALLNPPGKVWSRASLQDRIYDDHRVVSDRTVDSHIKNLRRKLQTVLPDAECIRSVYGVGYKLEI